MPFDGNFIKYITEKSLENYIFFLAFIVGIGAYSFWKPLESLLEIKNEGQIFYIGIAMAFALYAGAFLVAKYNTWKWFPAFVVSVCLSRVFTELNPELAKTYDWIEYAVFCATALLFVFYFLRHKHNKFYKNKN